MHHEYFLHCRRNDVLVVDSKCHVMSAFVHIWLNCLVHVAAMLYIHQMWKSMDLEQPFDFANLEYFPEAQVLKCYLYQNMYIDLNFWLMASRLSYSVYLYLYYHHSHLPVVLLVLIVFPDERLVFLSAMNWIWLNRFHHPAHCLLLECYSLAVGSSSLNEEVVVLLRCHSNSQVLAELFYENSIQISKLVTKALYPLIRRLLMIFNEKLNRINFLIIIAVNNKYTDYFLE